MKRIIAVVVAASLVMLLVAPVAAKSGNAQGNAYAYGHGDMVTGEIYWDRGTTMGTAWAGVSAHATKPEMGWFCTATSSGRTPPRSCGCRSAVTWPGWPPTSPLPRTRASRPASS